MALNAVRAGRCSTHRARAGKRLMINFSFRFAAQSQALKAQVEAGVFGDFYSAARRGTAAVACPTSAAGSATRRWPAAGR